MTLSSGYLQSIWSENCDFKVQEKELTDTSSPISNANLLSLIKKQISDAITLLIADLFYFKEST